MAGDTTLTLVGNLVDEPELRFTPSGAAVCKFRIASTPRSFNKQTNAWEDGESLFLTCSVWRQMAEHCAESLLKGMRVIVQGRLKQRSYETKEGEKRTVFEVEVDEVGPSLARATAKVTKAQPNSNGQQGGGNWNGNQQPSGGGSWGGGQQRQQAPQGNGGWGTPAGQQSGYSQEPPF